MGNVMEAVNVCSARDFVEDDQLIHNFTDM